MNDLQQQLKDLIQQSTLHDLIKEELITNIDENIENVLHFGELSVHEETLYEALNEETEEAWEQHFRDNIKSFPYDIITEHFFVLINKS